MMYLRVVAQVGGGCAAGLASAVASWGLLHFVVDSTVFTGDMMQNVRHAPPELALRAFSSVAITGIGCAANASVLRILSSVAGLRVALAYAATVSFVLLVDLNDSWPLSEMMLSDWRWVVAVLWSIAAGTGIGLVVVRPSRSVKSLAVPLAEVAVGAVTLFIFLNPFARFVLPFGR